MVQSEPLTAWLLPELFPGRVTNFVYKLMLKSFKTISNDHLAEFRIRITYFYSNFNVFYNSFSFNFEFLKNMGGGGVCTCLLASMSNSVIK
jgi:hypothetical protein